MQTAGSVVDLGWSVGTDESRFAFLSFAGDAIHILRLLRNIYYRGTSPCVSLFTYLQNLASAALSRASAFLFTKVQSCKTA